MTFINKQKFLAELGKLLTFMYEEDRQRAIGMYSRMFEEARDEQALIQSLMSPTRQAVVVARAYNSNLGRLSLTSESKAAPEDRDENGVPDYVQAIEAVREKAWAAQGIPEEEEVREEQPAEAVSEEAAESEAAAEADEPAKEEDQPADEADRPAEETDQPTDEAEVPLSEEARPAEETDQPADEAEPEAEAGEAPAVSEESETEESAAPGTESAAEADGPAEEGQSEDAEPEKESEPEAGSETPEEAPAPAEPVPENGGSRQKHEGIEYFTLPEDGVETPPNATLLDENSFNVNSDALKKIRRKPKVFALIVYILLAIPLTICAIAVLLVPALLFLALSIASIICGVVLVSTAFKGFAVFADIMVLLGVSLVLFAFGLLFLWTAIWFIGGAIVGVVHGVAVLCEKWCYKEVLEA